MLVMMCSGAKVKWMGGESNGLARSLQETASLLTKIAECDSILLNVLRTLNSFSSQSPDLHLAVRM
jgi:hypothetical protein